MQAAKRLEDYMSFSEVLHNAAKLFSEKIFLVENEREYSFSEFNKLVNRCSRMLLADGVEKGDIVSIILKNSVDYLVLYFAALRIGAKINPFPFHLSSEEIRDKIDFIMPKAVYTHEFHAKKLDRPGLRVNAVQSDKENVLEQRVRGFSEEDVFVEINPEDTTFMYYSSGTTGSPKIIEYTNKSEILTMASLIRSTFIDMDSCHLCMLPMGHTAAIRYSILPCLYTGSKVILFESFWKTRAGLWEFVNKYKATFFEIVPSILIAILNTRYEDFNRSGISSLRFIGCGSAYLSRDLQDRFEKRFNVPVANMYGLSETGPTHFDNPFEDDRKTGTIGRPLDIMDIKVFNENGKPLGPGELGEFGVKGPSLLKGYYKDKEQFESCFRDGYFLTGDIGYVDENGIFYYVDRKKDLIIKGGVNIVPSQIDEVLLSHKCVKEAATVGKPDMFLGEIIKSYIVLKEAGCVDVDRIKGYCKERLGDFKTPSEFEFVDELPKGPSGKILKRKLREKDCK